MFKFLMGTMLAAVVLVATPAMAAFQPYVDGHRTIATPNAVVIGGKVFEVKADPQTIEDLQTKITWIETQIYDHEMTKNALKATECQN